LTDGEKLTRIEQESMSSPGKGWILGEGLEMGENMLSGFQIPPSNLNVHAELPAQNF
jgi:hypothetical protein